MNISIKNQITSSEWFQVYNIIYFEDESINEIDTLWLVSSRGERWNFGGKNVIETFLRERKSQSD